MLRRLYGARWDTLNTIDKIGEVLGAAFVVALPIILLFAAEAWEVLQ